MGQVSALGLSRALRRAGVFIPAFSFANAECSAAVARMFTRPQNPHLTILDLFFTRLKVGSTNGTNTLALLDVCVLPMKTGIGDQWINLLGATANPTITEDSPTFHSEFGGYTTDGTNDQINTGYNPTTFPSAKFTRDSAAAIFLHFQHKLFAGSTVGRFATNGVTFAFRSTSDVASYRINQNVSDSVTPAIATGIGVWHLNRTLSNAIQTYRDGAAIDTGTNASTALINGAFLLGGIVETTSHGPGQFGGYAFGSSFTANQAADFAAAVIEYWQAFLTLDFFSTAPSDALIDLNNVPKAVSYSLSASRSALSGSWGTSIENWVGSCLGADRRIYHSPFDSTTILVVDPVTREAIQQTMGATIGSGTKKWHTLVLSSINGCAYGIPWDATSVLKINTKTRVATNILSGDAGLSGTNKWATGCEGPISRLIYGAPNKSGTIFRLNPSTDTYVATDMGSGITTSVNELYAGMYPVADGRIICVPYYATDILVIDDAAQTASIAVFTASDGSTLTGSSKWAGGVYSRRTGKIFGCMHGARDFLVINVLANTFKRVSLSLDVSGEPAGGLWACGFEAPDGYVYMVPHTSTSGLVKIDPVTEIATIVTLGASYTGSLKWDGVTLAENGMAVACPSKSADLLLIEGFTPNFRLKTLTSGYCNNF